MIEEKVHFLQRGGTIPFRVGQAIGDMAALVHGRQARCIVQAESGVLVQTPSIAQYEFGVNFIYVLSV